MAALYEVEKFCGVPVGDIIDALQEDPSVMLRLCYLGLKYGADESRRKFEMTYSEFVASLDKNLTEELSAMIVEDFKILIEILNERTKLNEEKEVGAKKKKPSGPTTAG